MASAAARRMCAGVGKSGSPIARLTIVRPCRRNSAARSAAALLGDVLMRCTRAATRDELTPHSFLTRGWHQGKWEKKTRPRLIRSTGIANAYTVCERVRCGRNRYDRPVPHPRRSRGNAVGEPRVKHYFFVVSRRNRLLYHFPLALRKAESIIRGTDVRESEAPEVLRENRRSGQPHAGLRDSPYRQAGPQSAVDDP